MDPYHHHPCHLIHHSATTASAPCCQNCYSPPPPPPPPHFSPNLSHHQPPYPIQQVNFQNYPYNHPTYAHPPVEPQDKVVISSLIRRIAALESSLSCHGFAGRYSLRDAAARTIQAHFRAFLVRRSRTLRQLKTLASIKSSLNALKMSVSESARVDLRAVSRKGTDLLLKIDSIQGVDSMIRDGKRSVSNDLDRFLGSIGLSIKKNKLSTIGLKSSKTRVLYNGGQNVASDFVSFGRDERGSKERTRAHVELASELYHVLNDDHDDKSRIIELENFRVLNNGKINSLPKRDEVNQGKAKKKVTFARNGDRSGLFVSPNKHNSGEDDDSVDEELVNDFHRRIQKIAVVSNENGDGDQEAYSEDEESSQTSNGEGNSKRVTRDEGDYEGDDVNFVISAPMAVKMEPRAVLAKTQRR